MEVSRCRVDIDRCDSLFLSPSTDVFYESMKGNERRMEFKFEFIFFLFFCNLIPGAGWDRMRCTKWHTTDRPSLADSTSSDYMNADTRVRRMGIEI